MSVSKPTASADGEGSRAPTLKLSFAGHGSSHGIHAEPAFMPAEHYKIGASVKLRLPGNPDGISTTDKAAVFKFQTLDSSLNNLELSYGQINYLAGDYFGTYEPISGNYASDVLDEPTKTARFMNAWELLAKEKGSEEEVPKLINAIYEDDFKVLKDSEKYIQEKGLQPSWIYAKKMQQWSELKTETMITSKRSKGANYTQDYPSYLGLLLLNVDHFGEDAHTAYRTGHAAACLRAIQAKEANDEKGLMLAYAMNAFADHFLEDSCSAGHLRTPRRALQKYKVQKDLDDVDLFKIIEDLQALSSATLTDLYKVGKAIYEGKVFPFEDLCASFMHNEDCALGIQVTNKDAQNPPLQPWSCYGDDYLSDDKAETHFGVCKDAVQRSIDEVWHAYQYGVMPEFKALDLAPDLASASQQRDGALAPLFKVLDPSASQPATRWGYPWYDLGLPAKPQRTEWDTDQYTKSYDYWLLALSMYELGYFNYPLLLEGKSPDQYPPESSDD